MILEAHEFYKMFGKREDPEEALPYEGQRHTSVRGLTHEIRWSTATWARE
jgi:hypothetical protein